MYWKQIWNVLPEEDKLLFLENFLDHNEELRLQFVTRFKRESSVDPLMSKESLLLLFEKEKAEILNHLESLDFVNFDWDNYIPRDSGYIPDYEAYEHMGEDMANQALSIPGEKILDFVRNGEIVQGAILLAAVYQACTEVYYEENYAFDDPEKEFLSLFQPWYEEILQEVQSVIIKDEHILIFLETLFTQYIGFWEDLKYFEPLIKSLVKYKNTAGKVKELLVEYRVGEEVFPQLLLQIHELMGDQDSWLAHANKYFREDRQLAEKLMIHYLEKDRKKFVNTAKEIFTIYPHTFDRFILGNLNVKEEASFYKMLLQRITDFSRDIEDYRILKDLLSPQEKELFYSKIWDKVFLVKIFEMENSYDRILQLIYSDIDSWDLNQMILPIIPVYPKECFEILENKIFKTLANERGRSVYRRIIDWIELLKQIPGESLKTKLIIQTAYHHKPALPALKDEMRMAGLV